MAVTLNYSGDEINTLLAKINSLDTSTLVSTSQLGGYYTSSETDAKIDEKIAGLGSGGTGNDVTTQQVQQMINNTMDGMTLDVCTTEEYNNLTEEQKNDSSKLYVLSDVEDTVVDMSKYVSIDDLKSKLKLEKNGTTVTLKYGEDVISTINMG